MAKENMTKKSTTIEWFLRSQFIKIGFVAGILIGLLGLFSISQGVQLAKLQSYSGQMSVGGKIALTVAIVLVIMISSILFIDFQLVKMAKQTIARVSEPVMIMDSVMNELSVGNLDKKTNYVINDEFAHMMSNADFATDELKKYISNISDTLQRICDKNLDFEITEEYLGEFEAIRQAMLEIADSLNGTILEIRSAFGQVQEGAESLSGAAQAMAEGAELQEEHIRSLVSNIEEISNSVHSNTEAAENVERLSKKSMEQMHEGEHKIDELTVAMNEIRKESKEIENIIAVITEIAEQTNLLALNASIEAARAGENGKGFAVVATEIGTLAHSSAEASQNIAALIKKSMDAVDNGVTITEQTVGVMDGIAALSDDISTHISGIVEDCKKQDSYLHDMLDSANEIAAVVDENTASAEESSALSEELLSYTNSVMDMIEQYTLKE